MAEYSIGFMAPAYSQKNQTPEVKWAKNLPAIPTPTPTNGYFLNIPAKPKAL